MNSLNEKTKEIIKEYIQSHVEIIDTENPYFNQVMDYCQRAELKAQLENQKNSNNSGSSVSPVKSLDPQEVYNPAVRVFMNGEKIQSQKKNGMNYRSDKLTHCELKVEKHDFDSQYKEIKLEEVIRS